MRTFLKEKKILWKLFTSTLYLSAFTFGGGYVIVTLMKKKFVNEYKWIDEKEMLDLVAIAQSAPGPIAVNGAFVVGYKLAGIRGLFCAILGTVIPPFAIISVISLFYDTFIRNFYVRTILDGMQAGVGAVIAVVAWEMGSGIVKERKAISIIVMIMAFLAVYLWNINVMLIILACILLGTGSVVWQKWRKKK